MATFKIEFTVKANSLEIAKDIASHLEAQDDDLFMCVDGIEFDDGQEITNTDVFEVK